MPKFHWLGMMLAAALAGCGNDHTTLATAPDSDASLTVQGGRADVSGHALVLLPFQGDAKQDFSVHAITHADGTVDGEFELKTLQVNGGRVHGTIYCVGVTGNTARLEGLVDQNTTATQIDVGTHVKFSVTDNGEGAHAPPDQASDFFPILLSGNYGLHCSAGLGVGGMLDVQSGNIQVR
jgi:hypothetical protein